MAGRLRARRRAPRDRRRGRPGAGTQCQRTSSWIAWAGDHWGVLVALLVLVAAVAAILWSGSRVLSVEPSDLAALMSQPDGAQTLEVAIGSGVTAPEFFTKQAFDAEMSALAHRWDSGTPVPPDDAQLTRLQSATESLREWTLFREAQKPFRTFQRVFVAAAAAVLGVTVYLPFALDRGTPIAEPFVASVEVSEAGGEDLEEATGCTSPETSTFLAVGGSWGAPVLNVDGPGCRFASTWRPHPEDIELRLP